jgi:cation:H+ antiporter
VLGLALLALAAVLLAVGADLFADNAAALAAGLGVTGLAVGLLFAGAEPEELVTAIVASARGETEIAAGDAIGANVTMLTLVLGAAIVLQPLEQTMRIRVYAIAAVSSSVLAAIMLTGGTVTRLEGLVLVLTYVGFVAGVFVRERGRVLFAGADADEDAQTRVTRVRGGALALFGLALVTLGGWAAVSGAERVVADLDLSASGVGLTLVAFATSSELLALLWAARRHRVTELAIAALVGSVVGNATASLGTAAFVRPLEAHGVVVAAWTAACLSALLLLPLDANRRRARLTGGLLVGSYVAFVVLALR